MVTKRNNQWLRWLAFAILVVSLLVYALWTVVWQLGFGLPGNANFYLHQSKYRSIVATAKTLPLEPGAQTSTRVDGRLVNVGRSQSGSYTVTITTVDWNHAGVFGYVFSDEPLSPHPNENYPDFESVDNPVEMPFSDKRIIGQGGHWWTVYNNLL